MTLLLRSAGRTEIARSLYRDIYNENDFFYFFVGRTTEWGDEESPEDPVDSVRYASTSSRNMLFVKRIQSSDTVLMIPRINWASGTVYDQYDDKYGELDPDDEVYTANSGAASLKDAEFYVLTDDDHVYKCIFNNSNAQSTTKPTGTSTSAIETADGYIWKFMFKVEASDKTKFLTPEYIPVRKIAGSGDPAFDVNGQIDTITITNAGSSYETAPTVIINGDGTGAVATATVSAGLVTAITISNSGEGYSFAYITFSGGGGSGAAASVTLGATESGTAQQNVENAAIPGTIDRIEILSGGIDYVEGDATLSIIGDGSGAVLLEQNEEGLGIQDSILKSDGSGRDYLHMKAGGSRKPATLETIANREHYAYQEGATVFKFAVTNMADVSAEVMERNGLKGDDIAWLVPHQANKRIIDATANRMGVGPEKVMMNIERYGNTTAATIPLCLWEYESQLKKGDNLILAAFGGGFTWGAIYLKWALDPKK